MSAAMSSRGYARDLLIAGYRAQVQILWSRYVLAEAEWNLQRKAPSALPTLEQFRLTLSAGIIEPSQTTIDHCATIVHSKDAPVVAAAVVGNANWLATYDRKHLLAQRAAVLDEFGITIATTDEVIDALSF